MKIVIPTFRRKHKQITFHNLCQKYQKKVTFVVRNEESCFFREQYPNNSLLVLPEHVHDIVGTRNYILDHIKGLLYILDDDLSFWKRQKKKIGPDDNEIKWKNISINHHEKEQTKLMTLLQKSIEDGYMCTGVGLLDTKPTIGRYPFDVNYKLGGNLCIRNTKKFMYRYDPKLPASEDLDLQLQILSSGHRNKVFFNYVVSERGYAPGGCSVYRTLLFHNRSNLLLEKKWPGFVKSKRRIVTSGPWKGKSKVHLVVQWKKTFQHFSTL